MAEMENVDMGDVRELSLRATQEGMFPFVV